MFGVGGGGEVDGCAVGDLEGLVCEGRRGDVDAAGSWAGDGKSAGCVGVSEELAGGIGDGGPGESRAGGVFNRQGEWGRWGLCAEERRDQKHPGQRQRAKPHFALEPLHRSNSQNSEGDA